MDSSRMQWEGFTSSRLRVVLSPPRTRPLVINVLYSTTKSGSTFPKYVHSDKLRSGEARLRVIASPR